jgi:hypothetical protein
MAGGSARSGPRARAAGDPPVVRVRGGTVVGLRRRSRRPRTPRRRRGRLPGRPHPPRGRPLRGERRRGGRRPRPAGDARSRRRPRAHGHRHPPAALGPRARRRLPTAQLRRGRRVRLHPEQVETGAEVMLAMLRAPASPPSAASTRWRSSAGTTNPGSRRSTPASRSGSACAPTSATTSGRACRSSTTPTPTSSSTSASGSKGWSTASTFVRRAQRGEFGPRTHGSAVPIHPRHREPRTVPRRPGRRRRAGGGLADALRAVATRARGHAGALRGGRRSSTSHELGVLGPDVLLTHCLYGRGHAGGPGSPTPSCVCWPRPASASATRRGSTSSVGACSRRSVATAAPASTSRSAPTPTRATCSRRCAPRPTWARWREPRRGVDRRRGGRSTAAMAFDAATLGGARFLGRDDLGRLAPGAKADVVLVRTDTASFAPTLDPIRSLVHYASFRDVDTVWVDGRKVLDGGRVDEAGVSARMGDLLGDVPGTPAAARAGPPNVGRPGWTRPSRAPAWVRCSVTSPPCSSAGTPAAGVAAAPNAGRPVTRAGRSPARRERRSPHQGVGHLGQHCAALRNGCDRSASMLSQNASAPTPQESSSFHRPGKPAAKESPCTPPRRRDPQNERRSAPRGPHEAQAGRRLGGRVERPRPRGARRRLRGARRRPSRLRRLPGRPGLPARRRGRRTPRAG